MMRQSKELLHTAITVREFDGREWMNGLKGERQLGG